MPEEEPIISDPVLGDVVTVIDAGTAVKITPPLITARVRRPAVATAVFRGSREIVLGT
jgi:hypothetical protein